MNKIFSAFLSMMLLCSTVLPANAFAAVGTVVEEGIVQQEESLNTEGTNVVDPQNAADSTTVTEAEETTKPTVEDEVVKETITEEETTKPEATEVEKEKETTEEELTEETNPTTPLNPQQLNVAQKLADIPNDFWAKNEVMQLVEMEVINGYPDGEFRPSLAINRGQAANLFKGALKLPEATYQAKFSDVSSKSGFIQGVFSTYAAGIFSGKPDGRFGVADALTREQMATTLVRAFKLQDTGEQLTFKDWDTISVSHRENVKILAQHGITTGRADGTFDPKATVNRVTFSVMLHRALVASNQIAANDYTIQEADTSANFNLSRVATNFVQVTNGTSPLYIRSASSVALKSKKTASFGVAEDTIYTYAIGSQGATLQITVRALTNGDEFVFSTLNNTTKNKISVDLFQKATNVTNYRLYRYDRFPIDKNATDVFGHDSSSYPTGLLRFMTDGKLANDRMVGQAYRSAQLTQKYPNGGTSYMRDLQAEYEALSTIWLESDFMSFYTLSSKGQDIVDTWYMDSTERLFTTDENMNDWMLETARNYKKRNNWYTANGPYNKMATTTEPMPSSYQGFGRNLLLVKEDRALVLYKEQGDRYFANLVKNSFVSLTKFKGDKSYWETEVTSTYLKSLYNMNAPFIDTRFNEQIALFYYNSGEEFNIPNYKQPLKNYADLLVSRKAAGHVIEVQRDAYYISDYFPINQNITTHSSMNHMLGGMNLLLMAYKEFGDTKYIETATAIQKGIAIEKDKWIRSNGDIWYRVSPKGQFAGTDYQHLTLEDLINSYCLWKDIDTTYLPVLEEMIASKSGYLSIHQYGYTIKIKKGLEELDMLKYLPQGPQHTDAL
ncbi:S-layer homology domain-containing protein [Solibacillus sp. FSL H8-0538]|uniref:S-layer homology domain-containing protein n=1 Tax=Solibacillus sp. FSL H8-0538 TaxID=2921400 RepID=UPI0030FC83ED